MPVEHVAADTGHEKIATILARDGCCVVDRLVPHSAVDSVRTEMAAHLERMRPGGDEFTGTATRRVGGLIARSPASHMLIQHPTVLGTVGSVLAHATSYRIHLTQIIAIGGNETAQPIHRDQWAFDFFPFPQGYEVQCNTIWAMTDFTEENGATRVISGSHRFEDKLQLKQEDTEPAEMEKGSVLIYTGALYHGGGHNQTDAVRMGLNLTYALSWLRQEENQYLSTPLEQARGLPRDLQRLMGYANGAYALGYVDDLRDPIEVLGGESGRKAPGF